MADDKMEVLGSFGEGAVSGLGIAAGIPVVGQTPLGLAAGALIGGLSSSISTVMGQERQKKLQKEIEEGEKKMALEGAARSKSQRALESARRRLDMVNYEAGDEGMLDAYGGPTSYDRFMNRTYGV